MGAWNGSPNCKSAILGALLTTHHWLFLLFWYTAHHWSLAWLIVHCLLHWWRQHIENVENKYQGMASGQAIAISLSCPKQASKLHPTNEYFFHKWLIMKWRTLCHYWSSWFLCYANTWANIHAHLQPSGTLSFILKGRTAPKVNWLVPSWMTEWLSLVIFFSNS